MQRTLSKGRRSGFVSGLGAASADAVYGAIAGFGLAALSSVLLGHRNGIALAGGTILLYVGIQSIRGDPASVESAPTTERSAVVSPDSNARSLAADFGSTFLLTLTNPVTILAFVGIFAGLGVGVSGDYLGAAVLVAGVFAGSALWWFVLSAAVDRVRERVTPAVLRRVNQLAGVVIVGFGVAALWSGL
ncbi:MULTISPECIES: LysE family translocator [Haloferax]|uniref:LysE family translocator n=1 Tax=Haloferax TaxID=2251 RepID=UPI001FD045FC|nr:MULTISPECIES: LysE family transporter [Haloferax]MDS0240070.1 LysE family translocator [Haloferax sp. S2CR25]MDS0443191.1 LysE family translocator [Haloferax sp. S2CR25-2]